MVSWNQPKHRFVTPFNQGHVLNKPQPISTNETDSDEDIYGNMGKHKNRIPQTSAVDRTRPFSSSQVKIVTLKWSVSTYKQIKTWKTEQGSNQYLCAKEYLSDNLEEDKGCWNVLFFKS